MDLTEIRGRTEPLGVSGAVSCPAISVEEIYFPKVPVPSDDYILTTISLAQQIEVDCSISVALQDEAPAIPTLRHMVGYVNGNHASESSHARKRYQEFSRRTVGVCKGENAFMLCRRCGALKLRKVVAGSPLRAKFQSRLEAEKESKIVGGNGCRAWFIGIAPEKP